MIQVPDVTSYKALLRGSRERCGKLAGNCLLMTSAIAAFAGAERLYAEELDAGVAFYVDEGRYYNLYYFLAPHGILQIEQKDKPVIAEVLKSASGGSGDAAERLSGGGFVLHKTNLQMVCDPVEVTRDRAVALAEPYSFGMCEEGDKEAVFALWREHLDVTDVPEEHFHPAPDDRIACIYDASGRVAAAHWWHNSGRISEGRHTVTQPGHYRKGLASVLLSRWIEDAKKAGCSRCYTWVSDRNERSLAMYQKNGFFHNGKISRQYLLQAKGE